MMIDMHLFNPHQLTKLASRWSNISKTDLIAFDVIRDGPGGSDWKRFNSDPMTFLLKLPPDKLQTLCNLINS